MRNPVGLIIIFLFALSGCKQGRSYKIIDNTIWLKKGDKTIVISSLDDDLLKVQYIDSLIPSDEVYAAVKTETLPVSVYQKGRKVTIATQTTSITVDLESFAITFSDSNGNPKLHDFGSSISASDSSVLRFLLQQDEAIYGAGGRALPINRRGNEFLSFNRPQYGYGWGEETLNYCLPHFMSSKDYMLLIDDPSKAYIDIGKSEPDLLEFRTKGDNLVYYFINGDSFRELIGNYTYLTGRQPLPPIWTLGHLQSRFGYRNQIQAEEILEKALRAGYPVDALIIDIYWFGPELEDGKMGELDWDLDNWPDPKGMISRLKEKGVRTVTVSEPFFTRKSQHYAFLDSMKYFGLDINGNTLDISDFYFGVGGLLDIFKPEAKDWMWKKYKEMKSYRIDGWWVDLAEPEKHPDSLYHINGPANKVHGLYGHEWAKMLAEGFQSDYPDERLFHMGRAGFAGSQRYGLLPWSGDVGRNWSGFKAQPSMMLSMGLSGLGYMHSDAGGFSMSETDPELYRRWLQFSAFTPIFRPHADESIPSEPVLWPQEVQDIVKPYVELRYKLLPYNYTLAWENSISGMPMARPIFTAYPEISDTIYNQYLWGDAFLICPVMEKGADSIHITIPPGRWYSYWSNDSITSGQKYIDVQPDHIPVFVKGGSIIPESGILKNTDEYTGEEVTLTYYYNSINSQSSIYFDDGKAPQTYENGFYHLLNLEVQHDESGFSILTAMEGNGWDGAPVERNFMIKVIGLELNPTSVVADQELEHFWDNEEKVLSFNIDVSKEQFVSVDFE